MVSPPSSCSFSTHPTEDHRQLYFTRIFFEGPTRGGKKGGRDDRGAGEAQISGLYSRRARVVDPCLDVERRLRKVRQRDGHLCLRGGGKAPRPTE